MAFSRSLRAFSAICLIVKQKHTFYNSLIDGINSLPPALNIMRIHAGHLHRDRSQASRRYRSQRRRRLNHARTQTTIVNGIYQNADERLHYIREEADEGEALRAITTSVRMMLIETQIDPGDYSTGGKHGRIRAVQHANSPANNSRN